MQQTRVALITLAAALSAPRVSPAQSPAPWPDNWHAEGQTCRALPLPAGVTKVEQVLDSAPVFSAVGDAARAKGWAVLSVSFDSSGKVRDVTVPASDLSEDVRAKVAAAAKGAVIAQSGAGTVQVRLRMQDGVHLALAPSERCEAHASGSEVITREIKPSVGIDITRGTSGRTPSATSQRPAPAMLKTVTAIIELTIAPDGRAVESRLKASSGSDEVDGEASRAAMRVTFLPALLDRMPVTGVATITYRKTDLSK